MAIRKASAQWQGDLASGSGKMALGSGAFEGPFSFKTRFEDAPGTNPEELIGAAHAGCFSMAFSHMVSGAGYPPSRVQTSAAVHLDQVEGGFKISAIDLDMVADIPGIDEATFREHAENAKKGCPVSQALAGVQINLNARLAGG